MKYPVNCLIVFILIAALLPHFEFSSHSISPGMFDSLQFSKYFPRALFQRISERLGLEKDV